MAHELGHAYGLYHANFWHSGDDNPIDNGYSVEYGDPFDTMAANWFNDGRVDFNPWFKYQLHWLHDDQVQTVTQSGTYRVYRFDDAQATGTLALKVAKDADRDYWVGYRRNFADNPGLQHGAYVVWGYHYPRQSDLLGLGPTINNARDPGLAMDTVLVDNEANITFATVAEGGTPPNEYLDVQIAFGPPLMITRQPDSQIALEGLAAQFTVEAAGNPQYIWQRRASGSGDWVSLSDQDGFTGSRGSTLEVNAITGGMNGDSFRCLLTNSAGGFNCSRLALLTVNALGVGTFAGRSGVQGHTDGMGQLAQFNAPSGIAVDHAGNAYVADTGNQVIRKITPAGVVSTLAGLPGSPGSTDGDGNNAQFNSPVGIAVDGAGDVYVADQLNSTIRKITPDGSVSTLAGLAGTTGARDGAAADALFNHPSGVAADCFGNVYVADTGNQIIRKIAADGTVSTIAGITGTAGATDGAGSGALFNNPMGIAVDLLGNSYVADQNSATIRKITLDGMVTTLAGLAGVTGSSDGIGAGALFSYPAGLAVDAEGNVYVADRNNSNVRQISPAGVVSTLAGAAGTNGVIDGASASALFSFPTAVAVDDTGLVYVADTYANTIRLIRSAPPQAPVLRLSLVAGQLILSWTSSATGFALETRGALSPEGSWVPVTSPVGVFGCSFVVTNSLASPSGFFRLHKR